MLRLVSFKSMLSKFKKVSRVISKKITKNK